MDKGILSEKADIRTGELPGIVRNIKISRHQKGDRLPYDIHFRLQSIPKEDRGNSVQIKTAHNIQLKSPRPLDSILSRDISHNTLSKTIIKTKDDTPWLRGYEEYIIYIALQSYAPCSTIIFMKYTKIKMCSRILTK